MLSHRHLLHLQALPALLKLKKRLLAQRSQLQLKQSSLKELQPPLAFDHRLFPFQLHLKALLKLRANNLALSLLQHNHPQLPPQQLHQAQPKLTAHNQTAQISLHPRASHPHQAPNARVSPSLAAAVCREVEARIKLPVARAGFLEGEAADSSEEA